MLPGQSNNGLKKVVFKEENIMCLQRLDFFKIFSDEVELKKFIHYGSWLNVPRGTLIIREGEIEDTFYVLIKGRLRVFKAGKTLQYLEKGEVFGEMGSLLYEQRSAHVMAVEDSYLFQFCVKNLHSLSGPVIFKIMRYMFKIVARRLLKLNRKFVHL